MFDLYRSHYAVSIEYIFDKWRDRNCANAMMAQTLYKCNLGGYCVTPHPRQTNKSNRGVEEMNWGVEPPNPPAIPTLYFQKQESLAHIFVAARMGLSSFNFCCGLQNTHLFCTSVRFGRSRSFRVIQGRWIWYISKARIRLPISPSLWL